MSGDKILYKGKFIPKEEYEKIITPTRTTLHGGLSKKIPISKIHSSNLIYAEVDVDVINSVAKEGYEYPLKVRPCNCPRIPEPHFEIIDGHNRFNGLLHSGQKEVASQIREVDDWEALDIVDRTEKVHKKSYLWKSLMVDTRVKVAEKKFGKEKSVLVVAQKLSNDVASGRTMVYTAQRIASMVYGMNELISSDPELRFLYQNQSKRINGDSKNGLESLGNHITAVIPNLELLATLSNFSRDELLTLCSKWEPLVKDPYKTDDRKSIIRTLLDDMQLFKRTYMKEYNNQTEETPSKPKDFPMWSNHIESKEAEPQEDILKKSLAKEIERANSIQKEPEIKPLQTRQVSPQSQTQTTQMQQSSTQQAAKGDLGKEMGVKPEGGLGGFLNFLQGRTSNIYMWSVKICNSQFLCSDCILVKQCKKVREQITLLVDSYIKMFDLYVESNMGVT